MKAMRFFFFLILWLPGPVFGMDPVALTNAVRTILPDILGAEHGCHEFMEYAATANKWTPEDCSSLLLLAQEMLKNSPDGTDVYRRENAIVLLAEFGSTNALDGLSGLIETETGLIQEYAATSFLSSLGGRNAWS